MTASNVDEATLSLLPPNSHHKCFGEDDPMIGVVKDDHNFCCDLRAFIEMPPGVTKDDVVKSKYTCFGKKLHELCIVSNVDLWTGLQKFPARHPHHDISDLIRFISRSTDYLEDDDHVIWKFAGCSICLANFRFVKVTRCCNISICQTCWQKYVEIQANSSIFVTLSGIYGLQCFGCDRLVPYNLAMSSIDPDNINLIRPPNRSFSIRCPECLHPAPPIMVEATDPAKVKTQTKLWAEFRRRRGGRPVICDRCFTSFCAACGNSDHEDVSCKELTNERGLMEWVKLKKSNKPEFVNARKCPSCGILISHCGLCPHMTCPCGAEFCYKCGRKYIKKLNFIFPSHAANRYVPLLSCPTIWSSKWKRLAVHWLIGIGVCSAVIVTAPVSIPTFGIALLVKKRRGRHRPR